MVVTLMVVFDGPVQSVVVVFVVTVVVVTVEVVTVMVVSVSVVVVPEVVDVPVLVVVVNVVDETVVEVPVTVVAVTVVCVLVVTVEVDDDVLVLFQASSSLSHTYCLVRHAVVHRPLSVLLYLGVLLVFMTETVILPVAISHPTIVSVGAE